MARRKAPRTCACKGYEIPPATGPLLPSSTCTSGALFFPPAGGWWSDLNGLRVLRNKEFRWLDP